MHNSSFFLKFLNMLYTNSCNSILPKITSKLLAKPGFKAAHSIETSFVVITGNLHAARSDKLLMVLILLDLSTLSITRLSYPSSQVLELVAQHGLYLTWRDSLTK